MAKEFYSIKNQRIEFDTELLTMTVVSCDDVFTNISVQKMNENSFNGQYLMFKANMFKQMASSQEQNIIDNLSPEDRARLQFIPSLTTLEDFTTVYQQALDYFKVTI